MILARTNWKKYFNSRPREGGDNTDLVSKQTLQISIRAPARGATRSGNNNLDFRLFQFAPPRGGRQSVLSAPVELRHFNSRPREGGDKKSKIPSRSPMYFNSRPREGGDKLTKEVTNTDEISIRAPARGATPRGCVLAQSRLFQFAPPRGGRLPHRSVRCHRGISIRAPARGATSLLATVVLLPIHFNSRPREGGDEVTQCINLSVSYFNSRPREGGDLKDSKARQPVPISIRAPARGATRG